MDGKIVIGTEINTKEFDSQIGYIEQKMSDIENKLKQADMGFEVGDTQKLEMEYEKLGNQLIGLKEKQEKYNQSIEEAGAIGFSRIKTSVEDVGNSITKITKKVAKWGLAVFGVRSAYMAIRRAISTVSQYNDQIKTDIAYIQFALASALEPIIKVIIGLAYKLLGVLNAISIALFNYNLFQNASINKFKKMNAGASKLKKTLAGFDEMNVLGDSGSGGGVGGATMPSMEFDTSLGEKFLSFWRGIIQFWENDWLEAFNSLTGQWATFFQGIGMIGKGFYDILKGIFETIKGAFKMLIALFKGDTSALYEGLKTMLNGLANIFKGIIEINIGVFKAAVGLVKGILVELVTVIYNNVIKPIGNFFANLWSKMVSGVKTAFNSITSFFSNIISKIMGMFKKIGSTAGDVVGKAFKAVINAILKTIEKILNTPIKAINSLIKTINKVPGINLGKLEPFTLPRLAKGGIVNMPGRGVPVGGALAGEVNREGVIPLTDSQQMALLGEAIGKYININATIPVYVGNRQIAREIQKIQSENDFAFNR